jgi:hypothetical protein
MKTLLRFTLATSAFLGLTIGAQAALLFVTSPANGAQGNRAAYNGTVGTEFTVGADDLIVTSLGYEDAGLNGLAASHQVGIWSAAGALVASVVVDPSDPLNDAWRFSTLGLAITLTAGETYRIGGVALGDPFTDTHTASGGDGVADFAISGDATLSNGALTSPNRFFGGPFANPANDGTSFALRWAPANMEYTVVPEPASAVLGIFGLLGLMRRRR